MGLTPQTTAAYNLLQRGSEALAKVSQNGIRIDTVYVEREIRRTTRKLKKLQKRFKASKLGETWERVCGPEMNLESNPQLSKVLFTHMKIEPVKITEKGHPSTDQEALLALDLPEIPDIIQMRKYNQVIGTYLGGLLRETNEDGFLRPFFHLHTAVTYRSSSSAVNFQNQPIRNAGQAGQVRRAFMPRPGNHLMEVDYGGIEVRIGQCYHHDPTMHTYIVDPTTDMHRDMGMQLFLLEKGQMQKWIRHAAKNGFVFPQFYGDWWRSCARNLWDQVADQKTANGTPVHKHLSREGFKTLSEFERHVESVEKDFWERRFKVYNTWRDQWWKRYQKRGYFDTLTGFRCQTPMARNDAINYPVQGSAFHCLLWSLIETDKWLRNANMKTLIVGQIHDSMILDVVPKEVERVASKLTEIMCHSIKKTWEWIEVPLEIEIELTPPNRSWLDKHEIVNEHVCGCGQKWLWNEKGGPDGYWRKCFDCGEVLIPF